MRAARGLGFDRTRRARFPNRDTATTNFVPSRSGKTARKRHATEHGARWLATSLLSTPISATLTRREPGIEDSPIVPDGVVFAVGVVGWFLADSTRSARGHLVEFLPAFCPQITPIGPLLPVLPSCKCCAVYYLWFDSFHGMEEVVGSIPTRSTKSLQELSGPRTLTYSSSNPGSNPRPT